MSYTPTPIPVDSTTSKWFTARIAGWLTSQFQQTAAAIATRQGAFAIDPRDFGLSGRGETNELAAFQKLLDAVPDRTAVRLPSPFKIGLYGTPELRNKTGVTLLSDVFSMDDEATDQGIQLLFGGSAGERVLGLYNCGYCTLSGFSIHGAAAGVGIDIDQTNDRKRICTRNLFKRLRVVGGAGVHDWTAVRLSAESKQNVEYMGFRDCRLAGNGGFDPVTFFTDAAIEQGSNVLVRTGVFPSNVNGLRVRLAGAGSPRWIGYLLDGHILERLDDHRVRLDVTAERTVTNARGALDEAYGVGLHNCQSFNAKRQVLLDCQVSSLRVGIFSQGGSVHTRELNAVHNDVNWWIEGSQSETSSEWITNSENSRQHAVLQSIPRFASYEPRLSLADVCPGTGYLRPLPGTYAMKFYGGSLVGDVPPGSAVWELADAAGAKLASDGTLFPYNYDEIAMGFARMEGDGEAAHLVYKIPNNCSYDSDDIQPGGKIFGRKRTWLRGG